MKDTKLISAVAVVSFPILVLLYACAVLGLPSGYVVQFGSITLNMGTSALFLMGVWSLAPLIIYILVHGNLFGENDYSMGTSALFLMGVWSLAPLIIYILVHGNLFGENDYSMGTSALFLMGVWSLAPLIIYILVHGNLFGENDYSERKEREKNE